VLVKGPSTITWISDMGGPRQDFIFPRVIEEQVLRAGRPITIQTNSVPSESVRRVMSRWPEEMLGFSPDVVILLYGWYEAIHLILPHTLERHVNGQRWMADPLATVYRRKFLKKGWLVGARLQQRLDRRDFPALNAWRRRRLIRNLTLLIERIQKVGSPLVLVMQLGTPGKVWEGWFPGLAGRLQATDADLRAMVDGFGKSNIRFFEWEAVVADHLDPGDEAMPDGAHFTPEVHRVIGETLAREVLDWANTQEHLRLGDDDH
jgi:hypothetical protein